ncbi:MAG: ATP-dependent sacrificial sulfur transferase LarE [Syntrophorhabdaceae bacterium]|nr:ATP-dependent sacrificial sulfur transferase LarE [Syntrophorhabdaceae bacterium]
MDLHEKYEKLKEIIGDLKRVVVAFSGGVDSSFLLKVSRDVLGKNNVIAFTGKFPAFPEREIAFAKKIAEEMDCLCEIVETRQLEEPDFLKNDKNRCYYCKRELMKKAWEIAANHNIEHVIEGSNTDDLNDYRPGMKACHELNIKSPLVKAGLNKKEIRELAQMFSLSTWNKPSFSCLATRIPYGIEIKTEILEIIDLSEDYIRNLGIKNVRVRFHGSIARIEVDENEITKIMENRKNIVNTLLKYGFLYITLDLKEYGRPD